MAWETKHEDTKERNVQLGNVASRVTICGTVTLDQGVVESMAAPLHGSPLIFH